jgi:hypothetical protein
VPRLELPWLKAIDRVAALQPAAAVAGHENKDLSGDPALLQQTRDYLIEAQRLLGGQTHCVRIPRADAPPFPSTQTS